MAILSTMKRVYALCVSLLPLMISSGMIYSVLPIYIANDLRAGEMQVGMLFTAGAATGAISSIFLGKLADKIDRKVLVFTSQIIFAAVMLLYSIINYYIYAYPIHILEGFAWAMISVSTPALIADIAKDKKGEAMGIYNTTWNLGWVIGPFFGGTLAQLYGFRLTLRISFLMILVGLILTHFLVKESR